MILRAKHILGFSVLSVMVLGVLAFHSSAHAATALPSASASVSPLNAGPNTQVKKGTLVIGTSGSGQYLCLNAPDGYVPNPSDRQYCVNSWSGFATAVGQYVALSTDMVSLGNRPYNPTALLLSGYPAQNGFVDIAAKSNQSAALVVKAPDVNFCINNPSQPGSKICADPYEPHQCTTNTDCGYTGTAVFGTSGVPANGRAAAFNGAVYITSTKDYQGATVPGRVCLGYVDGGPGVPSGSNSVSPEGNGTCISSWNQFQASSANYVKRFTTVGTAQGSQIGDLGDGALISGHATFGGAILGNSNAITNLAFTCGNARCESSENAGNCAVDCSSVPTPSQTAALDYNASLSNGVVNLTINVGAPQTGAVTMLVVRSGADQPLTFRPVDGVTYSTGTVVGNDTIIAVRSSTAGAVLNIADTIPNIQTGKTYLYRAFQANTFPRYSVASNVLTIKPYQLSLFINIPGAADIQATQAMTPVKPTGLYNAGTTDTVTIYAYQIGYDFGFWQGCDTTPPPTSTSCQVSFSSNRTVTLNVAQGSGGGGGFGGGSFLVE